MTLLSSDAELAELIGYKTAKGQIVAARPQLGVCNHQVVASSPAAGTKRLSKYQRVTWFFT
jgi:hypothetical protein